MADRFLIAPYDEQSGLHTNVKPFLIPDNAFSELQNAYVFRGRVRKRFGSRYMGGASLLSRFRVKIGTTTAAGAFAGAAAHVPLNPVFPYPNPVAPTVTPAIGQMFSIGSQVFTVNSLAGPIVTLLASGTASPATFNIATGAVVIGTTVGAAGLTDVYYYPSLPVMGLLSAETETINDEQVIGFDTRFAYRYLNGWERIDGETVAGNAIWIGNDTQFHWNTNWSGADPSDHVFFVTNSNENEYNYMRYMTPGTWIWEQFRPRLDPAGASYLNSARLLMVFKNRLVALNTWEGAVAPGLHYPNRARYSQQGSPIEGAPIITAWESVNPGKGNAIDAPTTEAIISAEFVKDRLIVYFERSTWELAYTNNQVWPFQWQQINTELGVESTHSVVPFDKVALGVGNVGVVVCNGSNTERIDNAIPDSVFQMYNANNAINRVYGIRDYFTEMVYWTFPNDIANPPTPYPTRVLLYNYKNNTWAFCDDSITCFGYYQAQTATETGVTWDATEVTWDDDVTWSSASNLALYRYVIAGNQQGYTFICDITKHTNASVLSIADLTVVANTVTVTCSNNNLNPGDYVFIRDIITTGNLNLLNGMIFQVSNVTQNTFDIIYPNPVILAGVYRGAGLISRVSKISIKTKEFNFYAKQFRNAYIPKVDFLVSRTSGGRLQVNYFSSSSLTDLTADGVSSGSIVGTGTLDTFAYTATNIPFGVVTPIPFEGATERIWHPVYFQAEGNVVQFQLTQNDNQMRDVLIRDQGFELHAMAITAQSTTQRLW